jgi:subtilisin family serine protease
LSIVLVPLASPLAAQETAQPDDHARAPRPAEVAMAPAPDWGGTWQYGPETPFQFSRFDGGFYPADGLVYFMGGRLASGNTPDTDGSVWSFDPVAGTYGDTGVDIVTPISNYKMNLLQDGVGDWGFYTFCGRPTGGGTTNAVQIYYPDTNTAVQLDPADDFPAEGCTSALNVVYENKVYVAGGFDPAQTPANWTYTYVFDPTAAIGSKWTLVPSATLNLARAYIMGAAVDGKIYAIGGAYYDAGTLLNTTMVEVMDPADGSPTWDDVGAADLPEECSSSRAYGFDSDSPYLDPDGTSLGGKVVSGCGFWPDENEHVYVYDTGGDAWEAFPWLNDDRRDHAAEFLPAVGDGLPGLWVWGGRKDDDTTHLTTSEVYGLAGGAQECNVLIVDDDWDFEDPMYGGGRPYYTSTLDYLGFNYGVWDTVSDGDPGPGDLAAYDVVVWFTGYAWNDGVFSPQNEADVGTYLDAGGNLLLSSQEYHYEAGTVTPFMQNYLGVEAINDDAIITTTVGVAGNVIGDGLGPYDMARPDDWYTYWPTETQYVGPYDDEVYAHAGGEEPFQYDDPTNTAPNATNFDGGVFRSVYLGWPFEWLDTVEQRGEAMGAALAWLCPSVEGGVSLLPPYQEDSGGAGEVIDYSLDLVNLTGQEDTFDISVGGNLWDVGAPATVGPVAGGATVSFTVSVTVPVEVLFPDEDMAVFTATSQIDPGVYGTAQIRTFTIATIDGHIYDANTGDPLAGYVYLYDADNPDIEYDAFADENGYYSITEPTLALGEYDIYGTMIGWGRVDDTVVLTGAQTTTVDFHLPAPMMSVLPSQLDVTVPPSQTRDVPLRLFNSGTGDLLFRVDEIAPGTGFGPMSVEPARPAGVDPQVFADLAASPDGTAEILVIMAEQADLDAAYGIADWEARGQYVYDTLKAAADRTQANVRKYLDGQGIAYHPHISLNSLTLTASEATVNALAAMPEVGAIRAGYTYEIPQPIFEPATAPDAIPWNLLNIGADQVWQDFGITGEGVVVANIDTGVEWDHDALLQQYRGNLGGGVFDHNYNWWDPRGACEIDGYPAGEPCDNDGHGTHTMGSMVGSDDPANPYTATNAIGVAPGAEWMTCKGCEYVEGWPCSTFALLECADFMVAPWDLTGANPDPSMRPHVVNNSWGGGPNDGWYFDAIAAWRAAGIFTAFSAGNAGPECNTVNSPSDYYNAFASGAVDLTDAIAGFSSRGPSDLGIMKPQVSAPGVNVRSSVPGNGYGNSSGTSMASPHSAGEVALIWSAQPDLIGNVQVTEWLMEQTADPILDDQCGPEGPPNYVHGWGRINAYNAVSTALMYEWDVDWMSVTPDMGTVAPGELADLTVTLDATGLLSGCFTSTLKIETNDPYLGLDTFVPVEMCVGELGIYLPIVLK